MTSLPTVVVIFINIYGNTPYHTLHVWVTYVTCGYVMIGFYSQISKLYN